MMPRAHINIEATFISGTEGEMSKTIVSLETGKHLYLQHFTSKFKFSKMASICRKQIRLFKNGLNID